MKWQFVFVCAGGEGWRSPVVVIVAVVATIVAPTQYEK